MTRARSVVLNGSFVGFIADSSLRLEFYEGTDFDDAKARRRKFSHAFRCLIQLLAVQGELSNGRRNILIEPEEVTWVVLGFDRGEPLPCPARIRGANTSLTLIPKEIDIGAAVALR